MPLGRSEGIDSILSVPIYMRGKIIGAVRVCAGDQREFILEDGNSVQALDQIPGVLIDRCRMHEGQNRVYTSS